MLKLIKPDKKYYNQYKEMMDEWNLFESKITPWSLQLPYKTEEFFNELLIRLEEVERGEKLNGYASSTTYWLYDDENDKIIGASNLRHYLTEAELKFWGHIGYGIRPSERRKGYATKLLDLTLLEAKKKNINRALLGAYVENIASCKVIEKCNGILENIVLEDETGMYIKRYWIEI